MEPIHVVITIVIAIIILVIVIGLALIAKQTGASALDKMFNIPEFIKQLTNQQKQ